MLTLNAKDLAGVLANVALAAEKRARAVVLSNVRIIAENGFAYFTCSNLDMSLAAKLPAEMPDGFKLAVTVPAHAMAIAAKQAGSATVSLWNNGNGLSLEYAGCKLSFPVLPVADFPESTMLEHTGETTKFTMPGATLRDIFDSVSLAISTEETRYYLNGIYWHIADGKMCAVATDGHQLGLHKTDVPAGSENMPGVIVPREAVAALLKLWKAKAVPENVTVCLSTNAVKFKWNSHCLATKTIDGTFPDYTRVLPKPERFAAINNGALATALSNVTAGSDKYSRNVKLEIRRDSLTVSRDENTAKLPCEFDGVPHDGFPFVIGLSAIYVTRILESASRPGETVAFGFATERNGDCDNGSPISIRGTRAAEYVLMPVRV
jgi:DNA polymerase III subunit beta